MDPSPLNDSALDITSERDKKDSLLEEIKRCQLKPVKQINVVKSEKRLDYAILSAMNKRRMAIGCVSDEDVDVDDDDEW